MIKEVIKKHIFKQFKDLTESEQIRCIELHQYGTFDNLIDDLIHDDVSNEIIPLLHDNGFLVSENNIEYDLNYVQGRGVCFYTKNSPNLQYDLLFDGLEIPHKKWLFDILDNYCEIELKKINWHYSHEKTVSLNIYFYDRGNTHARIKKMLEKMSDYAEKKRYDLSCEICEIMTKNFDYYYSDEFIKSELIENEYYFDDKLNIVDISEYENKNE